MKQKVIVIGAGIAGLSVAIRLATAGRKVLVLEQNELPGGKMGELWAEGFRWDTGPSVITMRHVLADLFATAGRRLEDYLTLVPLEPLTRYFYPDGLVFDATANLPEMIAQIKALDERDIEGYLAYLSYAARLHRITGPVFIYDEPPTWRSFTRVPIWETLQVDAWRTMATAIRSYVRSPHLRQLLGRFATYVGASPYQAPATLNVIAHVELTEGVWYPQGGVYQIARALAALAGELGVELRTNCPVQRIAVSGQQVQGVVLADGTLEPAGVVVANVDVGTVYERMLPPDIAPPAPPAGLKRLDPSCSGFILLLGVEGLFSHLAHHNIFFSADYRQEFDDIFGRGRPPADPTIYLAITARSDPAHAPPGCENWFVLVNAPALGSGFDWESGAMVYRDLVLERLARFGLDVRDRLRVERILTPLDLARLSGAWRGALYGASSNHPLTAFRRPHNRAPEVKGLYFAGGTTHPGGGVPMVMLSARSAAQMVVKDSR